MSKFAIGTGLPILALTTALGGTAALAADGPAIDRAGCAALAGQTFDAAIFGIPSGPATVDSSRMLDPAAEARDANGARIPATPAYCEVKGRIAPVGDAPDIGFQINLPAEWNRKVVQYGGGGYNGVVVSGLTPLRDARPDTPSPLMQGYVTAGNDSGHAVSDQTEIQAFALNDEALENFAHAAYKKLHDVTVALTQHAYGQAPGRYYYFGGSQGGREGLTMAQRYPQDFDGIVSTVPVINWIGLQSAGVRHGQLQRQSDAWLTPDAVRVLGEGVYAQCDMLDGLADGVIGNTEACRAAFDLDSLICAEGAAPGSCLTAAQAEVVRALHAPLDYGVTLANGITEYPGFPLGGELQVNGVGRWIAGDTPPTELGSDQEGRTWYYGNGAIRYFLARDPEYDATGYRMADLADSAQAMSALLDSTDPDLSAFAARGGKLILKENMADYAQSPYAGIAYYDSVVAVLGQQQVNDFLRFYLTPGADHSGRIFDGEGKPLPSNVDLLEQLDAWVEGGERPAAQLTLSAHEADLPYAETATRPLCAYPAYPHLTGEATTTADSFECRNPQ